MGAEVLSSELDGRDGTGGSAGGLGGCKAAAACSVTFWVTAGCVQARGALPGEYRPGQHRQFSLWGSSDFYVRRASERLFPGGSCKITGG